MTRLRLLSVCPPDVVLPRVATLPHGWQLVLVLRIHAFEHWCVLHHIWYDDESDLAPSNVHVRYHPLLPVLHTVTRRQHWCTSEGEKALDGGGRRSTVAVALTLPAQTLSRRIGDPAVASSRLT